MWATIEQYKNYLEKLKPDRWTTYKSWFIIGCILKNSNYDLFDAFNNYSKKYTTHTDSYILYIWNKLNKDDKGVGFNSLKFMAKEDNKINKEPKKKEEFDIEICI